MSTATQSYPARAMSSATSVEGSCSQVPTVGLSRASRARISCTVI